MHRLFRWGSAVGWGLVLVGAAAVGWSAPAYKTKHVFIVVMDGVRWTETFGDPSHRFIPHLYNDLRPQGTLFTNFYNRGVTVTRPGHSTLISGTWQWARNNGARLTMPTLFEYYRDEKGAPESKCWSVFGKGAYAFAHYSSHPAYGQRFAGKHVNGGGPGNPLTENTAAGDVAVLKRVLEIMKTDQPDIVLINFGYTDHAGHVAKDVAEYQAAIQNCDEQMWKLWEAIQADPYYRDTTTVFFTNDHGRHTDDFHGHGDLCDGCQHIMLLVLGPDIKRDTVVLAPGQELEPALASLRQGPTTLVSAPEALQIDVAVTAGELLGVQTPLATGRVLTECLTQYLGLNKKEAVTEAARQALEAERLANRPLLQVAADFVLAHFKPQALPVDASSELLVRGLVRAARETNQARYLNFVEQWLKAHQAALELPGAAAMGNVILDLPEKRREPYLPTARKVGELLAGQEVGGPRRDLLAEAIFLGRWATVAGEPKYLESGRQRLRAALAQPPAPAGSMDAAWELALLGQAVRVYDDEAVRKACLAAAGRALWDLPEVGALWPDPLQSVLNLLGLQEAMRGQLFKDFRELKKPEDQPPPAVQAMGEAELRPLFPRAPSLEQLRRRLTDLCVLRGTLGLAFSVDHMKYAVSEAGAYADGSAAAQGGFLLVFRRLEWKYGGNTWPGPPLAGQKGKAGA
jgi:hypothetical protein